MKSLYKNQKESREANLAKSLNKKSEFNPFLLFPIRLETRFRTVEHDKNDAILDYNDCIWILQEINQLQEEIIAQIDTKQKLGLGKNFYKKVSNIHRKLRQIDSIPTSLKGDMAQLLKNTFSIHHLKKIKMDNPFLFDKIITKVEAIKQEFKVIKSPAKDKNPKQKIIKILKKIEKDLAIISDFDRTSYRAISQLSNLKLPLNNVIDRNDVIISALKVELTDKYQNNNNRTLYLNIGKRRFEMQRNDAQPNHSSNVYTFLFQTSDFILDDLVNSMIYLSLDTGEKWRPTSFKLSYINQNKQHDYLERKKIEWPCYQSIEDEIIKLQKEAGANPRLKKYLYKKIHTLPRRMQAAFNSLYIGLPLSLKEKEEIDGLIDSILEKAPMVRENVTSIYNPKYLKKRGRRHGRRPHVNVPERIKKMAQSKDGIKEYLELHQEALTVFYDVHCDKYIRHAMRIGHDLQSKELTTKNVKLDNFSTPYLIIETIKVNKYLSLMIKKGVAYIDSREVKFLLENTPLEKLGKLNLNKFRVSFNTLKEYDFFNKQLKTLKSKWRYLLQKPNKKMADILKHGAWIERLPYPFPKRMVDTAELSNKQLCVRIFPDDIFISQFRKPLNSEEFTDAKDFHILWFIFSGNPILARSLWDSLVTKYGVHRASWLVRVFSPQMKKNISKRPYNDFAKSYLGEINNMIAKLDTHQIDRISVIKILEDCSTSLYNMRNKVYDYQCIPDILYHQICNKIERVKESFAYYEKYYEVIDTSLKEVDKEEMELWDKDYHAVLNFKHELDDFLYHLKDKQLDLKTIKENYKNKYFNDDYFKFIDGKKNELLEISDDDFEAHSPILPDRFVFWGYIDGEEKPIKAYGRKVNPNLQLSFSDEDEEELDPYLLDIAKGDVQVEGGLKWLFDYEEAVRNGMAITIPLSAKEYDATFSSIYVLGVKDAPKKNTLEELFYSHIYTRNSLDFLEVGTPTNQLESNRRHYQYLTEQAQIDRRFKVEVERYGLTENETKFVGEDAVATSLAKHLNISEDTFTYLNSCDLQNYKLPKDLVELFLPKLNDNKNNEENDSLSFPNFLSEYVSKYIFPKGILPTLRIGDMPYGILPTTDFSNLTTTNENLKTLSNFLNELAKHWDKMFENKVEMMNRLQSKKEENAQVRFMRMMSANPHSVSYQALKMIQHKLLVNDFHFKGNYKDLPEDKLKEYATNLDQSTLGKLSQFSYFPTGEMLSNKDSINHFINDLKTNNQNIPKDFEEKIRDLIDLFSYRLDAWLLSLVNYKLLENKNVNMTHIGAYGWLFNLKRESDKETSRKQLNTQQLKEVVEDLQLKDSTSPIYEEQKSEGIMLAPSINHAVTAAVMRSAYSRSKKTNQQDNRLSVNLSSGRMQRAMQVINGVSNGLSVGAILGAYLERGLHEAYKHFGLEMDKFIFPLRQKYPLNMDSYATSQNENAPILQGLNGAMLLEDIFESTQWYDEKTTDILNETINNTLDKTTTDTLADRIAKKFNFDTLKKGVSTREKKAFGALVEQIADTYDAVNDLILSEGVYQLVKGNRTALSALMNKMEHNSLIARPEILDIPMRSISISHRLIVNFKARTTAEKPNGWEYSSVLDVAEPSLNYFVGELLGNPEKIGIYIETEKEVDKFVSLKALKVTPLEYLYLSANKFAFTEMLLAKYRLNNDYWLPKLASVETPKEVQKDCVSITEQSLFIESLRKMVQSAMQLKTSHFIHQTEQDDPADQAKYYNLRDLLGRLKITIGKIGAVKTDLEEVLFELQNYAINNENNGDFTTLLEPKIINSITNTQFKNLIQLLTKAYSNGVITSIPPTETLCMQALVLVDEKATKEEIKKAKKINQSIYNDKKGIVEQAVEIYQTLNNKLPQKAEIESLEKRCEEAEQKNDVFVFLKKCNQMGEKVLMKNFKLLPYLQLSELKDANKKQLVTQLAAHFKYDNTTPHQMEDWVMDLAKVRKHVKFFHDVRINTMLYSPDKAMPLTPIQLPFNGDSEWAGMEFSDEEQLESKEATVLWNAKALEESLENNNTGVGFVVDNWIELIPKRRQNAGAVFHYDVPNAEPPQTILLALSPQDNSNGKWSEQKLVNILEETKRMAKYRLVEPEMINDDDVLSRILPIVPLFNIQK